MNRRSAAVVAAVLAAGVCSAALAGGGASEAAAASSAAAVAGWGKAIEVPGMAALNTGEDAEILSVSCAAAGSCAAGGYYTDRSGDEQAFVVSEVKGIWGTAVEVAGTAALNKGGIAYVHSVSCAAPGNCAAGGAYAYAPGSWQAFVVTEAKGQWGKAIEAPGTAALNNLGYGVVASVSCASAGNCVAGGQAGAKAFVVSEVAGRWGKAIEVPGIAALSQGGGAYVASVSCAAPGSCAAGGYYGHGSAEEAFVVSEVKDRWGKAIEVPGTAALDKGLNVRVNSVSCAAPGDCAAGGYYDTDIYNHSEAFIVTEADGRWGTAVEVPGTAALNKGRYAEIYSVSCAAPGSCAAGGYYTDRSGKAQAFVVSEAKGRWSTAVEVPGTGALDKVGSAETSSVSCAAPGNCAAGGSSGSQAFVVSEVKGDWGTAAEVPGTAVLDKGGDAGVSGLSCTAASCVGTGSYAPSIVSDEPFVVSGP